MYDIGLKLGEKLLKRAICRKIVYGMRISHHAGQMNDPVSAGGSTGFQRAFRAKAGTCYQNDFVAALMKPFA